MNTPTKTTRSFCRLTTGGLALLLFLSLASIAQSPDSTAFTPPHQEKILSYDSDIRIARDGKLTVTTTIQVWAMGREIKRGIYRKFPVRYTGRGGEKVRVPFDVLSVKRDGHSEPYHIKSEGAYKILYIGNKDKRLVRNKVYTYEFTYQTNRQLGYFGDYDELYWNVNGTEWGFPIDKISAVVTLPEKVAEDQLRIAGYTGPKGSQGKAFRSWVDDQGRVRFETTRLMLPGSCLTIAVGFPKNIVQPPSAAQQQAWFFQDNAVLFAGIVGLLAVLGYYSLAWLKVGRDPPKGVIYPRYVPPKHHEATLSPAGAAYVNEMKASKRCITASMIHFAVRGAMTIKEIQGSLWTGKSFTLRKTEGDASYALEELESKAFRSLFASSRKIEVKKKNHRRFRRFKETLFRELKREYCGKDKLFITNTGWFVLGVIVSLGAIALAALGGLAAGEGEAVAITLFMSVWLSIWTLGVIWMGAHAIRAWKNIFTKSMLNLFPALVATVVMLPFLFGEVVGIGFLLMGGSYLLASTALSIGVLNYFFFQLLKQPTPEGARVQGEIEGFKMYLCTAEEDDLQRISPEQLRQKETPEIFEAYLPYAIALGVEVAWTKRFEEVLAAAQTDPSSGGYHPSWYQGGSFSSGNAGMSLAGAIGGLTSSFGSSLSSAGTAPGSSSGSSGGGSSGGGGGGGGGGGW